MFFKENSQRIIEYFVADQLGFDYIFNKLQGFKNGEKYESQEKNHQEGDEAR